MRNKGEYWAAVADDRLASITSVTLSLDAVEERFGDDRYGRHPDRADELPDLDERGDVDGETRDESEEPGG